MTLTFEGERIASLTPAFDQICSGAPDFHKLLVHSKAAASVDFPWYPYDTMANFFHIAPLISSHEDYLFEPPKKFADIGAADGDLAFYLSSLGFSMDIYDYAPTNMNGLRGARFLQSSYGPIDIHEADLDSQWDVGGEYDLVFLFGVLYHLKNPFHVLERLSFHSRFLLLSTRIARHFWNDSVDVSTVSAAYLLAPDESNNDSTNYWIFTEAGLKRLFSRTGWRIPNYRSVGSTESNPRDNDRDERAFALLGSVR
jgi:hypothetical protein